MAVAERNARAIDTANHELLKIAPQAGTYVSESNYFNKNWGHAFWGPANRSNPSEHSKLRAAVTPGQYKAIRAYLLERGVDLGRVHSRGRRSRGIRLIFSKSREFCEVRQRSSWHSLVRPSPLQGRMS